VPMTDDAFANLVAEEVKGKVSDSQRDYLNLPENWDRWHKALIRLSQNLQNQLENIAEREESEKTRYEAMGADGIRLLTEFLGDMEMRRKRITRFKFFVDQRLDEVSRMLELGGDEVSEREGLVEFLRAAIERHRNLLIDNDMEATPVDQALWAALEGRWEFDAITPEQLADLES
jgi:hypothetical protein